MNVILWDNSCLDDVNWDTIMDDHARVSGNNKMVVYTTWTGFSGRMGLSRRVTPRMWLENRGEC